MPSGRNLKNTLENIVRMEPGKISNRQPLVKMMSHRIAVMRDHNSLSRCGNFQENGIFGSSQSGIFDIQYA